MMEGDDLLIGKLAGAATLIGVALGVAGAWMIWGIGGALLFIGILLIVMGVRGK